MRMSRITNFTMTAKDTWYKIFDEKDYKQSRIEEVKIKLRETTTADHFRYGFEASPTEYVTSSTGIEKKLEAKEIWAYIPDVALQVMEIEIVYK